MNNKERLESHKRIYSWLEEQAEKNKYFDEEDRISDWETLTDLYPELLTLVEDLISHLESYVKREQELFDVENHILWIDYRDYKFKIYLDAERNTLVGEVLVGDELDARGFESNSLDCLIERLERHSDEQSSYKYQNQLAKENIQLQDRIKELKREIEKIKQEEEEAQRFLDNVDRVNKENYESKYSKIIATVYWWTKEPEDEFVDKENITEKLDEELLESLGLRYGSNLLTTINQIDYVSELIESKIDVEEYDYFFEYHGDK